MVTIEQVELLEAKVSKAIDYVNRLSTENERLRLESSRLSSENNLLYGKLDGYQARISELEVMLQGFKKDQERIEKGIVSALERLNHFEDSVGAAAAAGVAATAGAAASVSAAADAHASETEAEVSNDIAEETPPSFGDDLGEPEVTPPAVPPLAVPPPAASAAEDESAEQDEADSSEQDDDALDILKNGRQEASSQADTGEAQDEEWSIENNSEKPPEINPELDIY